MATNGYRGLGGTTISGQDAMTNGNMRTTLDIRLVYFPVARHRTVQTKEKRRKGEKQKVRGELEKTVLIV